MVPPNITVEANYNLIAGPHFSKLRRSEILSVLQSAAALRKSLEDGDILKWYIVLGHPIDAGFYIFIM